MMWRCARLEQMNALEVENHLECYFGNRDSLGCNNTNLARPQDIIFVALVVRNEKDKWSISNA